MKTVRRASLYHLGISDYAHRYLGKFVFEEGTRNDQGLRDPRFSGRWNIHENIPYPQLGLITGRVPELHWPEPLTDDEACHLPNPVRIKRISRKPLPDQLPDFLPSRNPIISGAMRDAILAICDRSQHQFFPTSLADSETGEPLYEEKQWFFWCCLKWLPVDEALDLDAMGGEGRFLETSSTKLGNLTSLRLPMKLADYIFRRSIVDQCDLCRISGYLKSKMHPVSGCGGLFVNSLTRQTLKDAGLKGLVFYPCKVG